MAFKDVPPIENYKVFIDTAFKRAQKINSRNQKDRQLNKIDLVKEYVIARLIKIMNTYPNIDELDPFYKELFKQTLEYADIKKSLGGVAWALKKVTFFHKQYSIKLKKTHADEPKRLNSLRTEFYGRINSIVKQIKDNLTILEASRKVFSQFPTIKTAMNTVCIIGFPNVGKTTLLFKLTGSKPDIKPYAFTTKGINISYMENIQLLDTPGTLNREVSNKIELVSELAIKYLANSFVFVFDPILELGKQITLYNKIKKLDKPVLVYVSKTDVQEDVSEFKKYKPLSLVELKKELELIQPQ